LEEAYEEFRETFEDGIVKTSKIFIRGDVVNPDKTGFIKFSSIFSFLNGLGRQWGYLK